MSLGDIRDYYRTKLDALNFHEWPDAFNSENIPSTVLDRAYHLDAGLISSLQLDQRSNDVSLEVIVRFFIRGFSDPIEALDQAHVEAEDIISSIMAIPDRNTGVIKNIQLNSGSFEPLSESNDNSVIGLLSFENYDVICF